MWINHSTVSLVDSWTILTFYRLLYVLSTHGWDKTLIFGVPVLRNRENEQQVINSDEKYETGTTQSTHCCKDLLNLLTQSNTTLSFSELSFP